MAAVTAVSTTGRPPEAISQRTGLPKIASGGVTQGTQGSLNYLPPLAMTLLTVPKSAVYDRSEYSR